MLVLYNINYGLAWYFKDLLITKFKLSLYFALFSYERLNDIMQEEQMGIYELCFDQEHFHVCTRHLALTFWLDQMLKIFVMLFVQRPPWLIQQNGYIYL